MNIETIIQLIEAGWRPWYIGPWTISLYWPAIHLRHKDFYVILKSTLRIMIKSPSHKYEDIAESGGGIVILGFGIAVVYQHELDIKQGTIL